MINSTGRVERKVYDPIQIKVMDRKGILDVMEVPDGVPPMLEYLVLKNLDIYRKPIKQSLEGSTIYYDKMVMNLLYYNNIINYLDF